MTEHVNEAKEVIVGKFYFVPCRARLNERRFFRKFVPLLGPRHEDTDLGVKDEHWHIDWRFASDEEIGRLGRRKEYPVAIIESDTTTHGPIVMRRMKCRRAVLLFPSHAPWQPKLEDKYAAAIAKCDTCPHRGISLRGAPVVEGARVCPGHGLAWNVETGKLQRRTDPVT